MAADQAGRSRPAPRRPRWWAASAPRPERPSAWGPSPCRQGPGGPPSPDPGAGASWAPLHAHASARSAAWHGAASGTEVDSTQIVPTADPRRELPLPSDVPHPWSRSQTGPFVAIEGCGTAWTRHCGAAWGAHLSARGLQACASCPHSCMPGSAPSTDTAAA